MTSDDPESALRGELRDLGGRSTKDEFPVAWNGITIDVSIITGSSASITFSTLYDTAASGRAGQAYRGATRLPTIRPMQINLVPEEAEHREHKADGTSVEHQTGDPTFDAKVYIDTPTSPDVLAHVLNPDVRAAVLELFARNMTSIYIDDVLGRIRATIVSFVSLRGDPPARPMLDAFAKLARSLPALARTDGAHPEDPLGAATVAIGIGAIITFVGSWPLYFGVTAEKLCKDDMGFLEALQCGGYGIFGLGAGAIVGWVVRAIVSPWLKARYRGTSSSGRRISTFVLLLFFFVASVSGSTAALVAARLFGFAAH